MSNHIASRRKSRAIAAIRAKIAVLERFVSGGIPENSFVPRSLAEFRRWEDSENELTKIGSPNTLDKSHNRQLKLKAQELIAELSKRRKRKTTRVNEKSDLHTLLRDKDRLITDLTNQWHSAEHGRINALQKVTRLSNRLTELLRDNAELTKKLNAVAPLTRRP